MFRRLTLATLLCAFGFAVPATALAGGPERSTSTFSYTLADALADYQAFGDNGGDCGDFVLLVDYDVVRDVSLWPDREVRHVHYTGHFYSSADTSRSIERSGDFKITFWLDANGFPTGITRTGVFEYVVVDGQRINTKVGRDELSFATGLISATPRTDDDLANVACEALD